MKRKVLVLVAVMISMMGYSQGLFKDTKWFIDFGPKFMVGPSWVKNGNTSYDTTKAFQHTFNSYSYNVGFKFAFDFNDNIAIASEYLFTNINQNYFIDSNRNQIRSKGREIPLMLRYNRDDDVYYEAGVVFGKTKSVTEILNGTSTDYTDLYNNKSTGLVIGSGGYAFGVGNWGVSTGFRFRYNLTDMVNPDNTKILGTEIYALDNRADISKNMAIMLVLEFNYDLGFTMAKSACGRSRKLLFQRR